jgi:hypothetical protein
VVTRKRNDYDATCSRTTSSASAPRQPAPPAKPANCRFNSAVLYTPHLNAVAARAPNDNNSVHHVDLEALRREEEDRAFQAVKGMEKHQIQYGKKNGKQREYEPYESHKGHSGSPAQRGSLQKHQEQKQQQQPSASESRPVEERTIRGYDRRMIDDVLTNGPTAGRGSPERGKAKRDRKAVCSQLPHIMRLVNADKGQSNKLKGLEQPQEECMLLPQGETAASSRRDQRPQEAPSPGRCRPLRNSTGLEQ